MAINITTISNNLEKAQEELFNFVNDFDGDLSGQNGKAGTLDSAIEKGFDSTMEYFISEGLKATENVKEFIKYVMGEVRWSYNSNDYSEFEISELNDDKYILVFARSNE